MTSFRPHIGLSLGMGRISGAPIVLFQPTVQVANSTHFQERTMIILGNSKDFYLKGFFAFIFHSCQNDFKNTSSDTCSSFDS